MLSLLSVKQSIPKSLSIKWFSTNSISLLKKSIDENKPKKPMSAYFLFANEIRSTLKNENPEKSVIEIAKLTGDKWRSLNNSLKDNYINQYNSNLEKYQQLKIDYLKTLPPKKPSAPYLIFSNTLRNDVIKQNPDLLFADISKIISGKWKALSDDERKKFTDKFHEEFKNWKQLMVKFNQK